MPCKVDRVADDYALRDYNGRLQRLRDDEDASLRDLERYLNTWILKRAMSTAGMTVLDGEPENHYRLLTADDEMMDVASDEARGELEQAGIDVEQLEKDFVSYQTVRTHFNDCLDEDTSEDYTPNIDDARNTFKALSNRVENVVAKSIDTLRNHDAAHIGEPEVTTSIKIRCDECGRTHDAFSFLDAPTCECKGGDAGSTPADSFMPTAQSSQYDDGDS